MIFKSPILNNLFNSPAPLWWRVTKTVWVYLENIILGVWLLYHPNQQNAIWIAAYKLISSQTKEMIDNFIQSAQEYAPKGSTDALKAISPTSSAKDAVSIILNPNIETPVLKAI